MRNIWYVNGRDIGRDFGFAVRRIEGLGAAWSSVAGDETLIGRAGSVRDIGHIPVGPRSLVVRGAFVADDTATLRANVRAFFRWVRHSELHEIETVLHADRVVYARLLTTEAEWADPQGLQRATQDGSLVFHMHSPLLYDRNFQMYTGAPNTRIMPVLGTFPSTPELYLSHCTTGVNNPTVSLYRANGSLVKTVTFTQTLATDDYILQVCDDLRILRVLNGVIEDAPNIAPAGDPFFILDPADGDPEVGLFPYFVSTNAYLQVLVRRLDIV